MRRRCRAVSTSEQRTRCSKPRSRPKPPLSLGKRKPESFLPQLTPQALGRFLGAQKACWVLSHKIDDDEKAKLSQLMKVFMDLSDEYPELKIIALGAVRHSASGGRLRS